MVCSISLHCKISKLDFHLLVFCKSLKDGGKTLDNYLSLNFSHEGNPWLQNIGKHRVKISFVGLLSWLIPYIQIIYTLHSIGLGKMNIHRLLNVTITFAGDGRTEEKIV